MENTIQKFAIIVAGGSGTRMKSSIPKQFLELEGIPVLMHTITRFYLFDKHINIIVVLPAQQTMEWQRLCEQYGFSVKHSVTYGGETRFQSVKNGLSLIPSAGIVAIHDGVRPLVSHETLRRCFNAAFQHGNAIPCIPIHETVRKINNSESETIDRSALRLIQTPQVFDISLIKKAYELPYQEAFTDDASVLEYSGEKVNLVDGNRENIKITEPSDLLIASAFMKDIR